MVERSLSMHEGLGLIPTTGEEPLVPSQLQSSCTPLKVQLKGPLCALSPLPLAGRVTLSTDAFLLPGGSFALVASV